VIFFPYVILFLILNILIIDVKCSGCYQIVSLFVMSSVHSGVVCSSLVTSSDSLHPVLHGDTSCNSSQENIVAAIVQRAAAEAAARSSRQSSVDVASQPLQLPVSSLGQVHQL